MAEVKIKNYFKNFLQAFWVWLIEWLKLAKETILFIFGLPRYTRQFLEGIKTVSKTYAEIIKANKDIEEMLKKPNFFNHLDPQRATSVIVDFLNKAKYLRDEQEKMFYQFFGIILAVFALVVSICVLVIKK